MKPLQRWWDQRNGGPMCGRILECGKIGMRARIALFFYIKIENCLGVNK